MFWFGTSLFEVQLWTRDWMWTRLPKKTSKPMWSLRVRKNKWRLCKTGLWRSIVPKHWHPLSLEFECSSIVWVLFVRRGGTFMNHFLTKTHNDVCDDNSTNNNNNDDDINKTSSRLGQYERAGLYTLQPAGKSRCNLWGRPRHMCKVNSIYQSFHPHWLLAGWLAWRGASSW